MTILKILTYPNPRLYKIAKPVDEINKCHQDLIKNMIQEKIQVRIQEVKKKFNLE